MCSISSQAPTCSSDNKAGRLPQRLNNSTKALTLERCCQVCLSDVQAPQVAMTPYTAAFMVGRTHKVAGGRKMTSLCPHLIQWFTKPSMSHRHKTWSAARHNTCHTYRMQNEKGPVHLPFLYLVFCVNTVQESIVAGLERERIADVGLDSSIAKHPYALVKVSPHPLPQCVENCVAKRRSDDDPSFSE